MEIFFIQIVNQLRELLQFMIHQTIHNHIIVINMISLIISIIFFIIFAYQNLMDLILFKDLIILVNCLLVHFIILVEEVYIL